MTMQRTSIADLAEDFGLTEYRVRQTIKLSGLTPEAEPEALMHLLTAVADFEEEEAAA
tara:strand:+ start:241 stop:414 length:174 start_codon:yes stop_codon:yes gene_type:complete